MATYANMLERVNKVIDDGRLWMGQPTARMEQILRTE